MANTATAPDISKTVEKWQKKPGSLIMALHEIQGRFGYVPREVSMEVARLMDVPLARIYEVVTFYNFFRIEPPGKHNLAVCMGTACYLKGAPALHEALKKELDLDESGTTPDREFHVETVRCVGCCGLAPVVVADGETLAKVKPEQLKEKIHQCRHKDAKGAA